MSEKKETVLEKAEDVKETVLEKAEDVKETVFEKAEDMKEAAREVNQKVKRSARKTAEKATEKAKKATKTVKKTMGRENEVYFQVFGNEYKESDIIEKVEAAYKESGHRIGTIKNLKLYIKPEENAAYYVINDKNEGKVELL